MRKTILILISLILMTFNGFAFDTQTAVENSEFATAVMEELNMSAEQATVFVAEKCLIWIAKNMHRPLDVFDWDDDKAEEVSAVVNDFYCLALLGREYDELEYRDAVLYENVTIFVEDVATLVETFGFDAYKALDVAVKTTQDIYGE